VCCERILQIRTLANNRCHLAEDAAPLMVVHPVIQRLYLDAALSRISKLMASEFAWEELERKAIVSDRQCLFATRTSVAARRPCDSCTCSCRLASGSHGPIMTQRSPKGLVV
jgi:hypothetical protein